MSARLHSTATALRPVINTLGNAAHQITPRSAALVSPQHARGLQVSASNQITTPKAIFTTAAASETSSNPKPQSDAERSNNANKVSGWDAVVVCFGAVILTSIGLSNSGEGRGQEAGKEMGEGGMRILNDRIWYQRKE